MLKYFIQIQKLIANRMAICFAASYIETAIDIVSHFIFTSSAFAQVKFHSVELKSFIFTVLCVDCVCGSWAKYRSMNRFINTMTSENH